MRVQVVDNQILCQRLESTLLPIEQRIAQHFVDIQTLKDEMEDTKIYCPIERHKELETLV
jgi:hypothetical protein